MARLFGILLYLLLPGTVSFGDEPSVAQFVQQLEDPDPGKVADAAEALGQLGPAALPALRYLVRALGDDRETPRMQNSSPGGFLVPRPISSVAYEALERIGEPAVPFLVEELRRRRRATRQRVIRLLGEIGTPAQPALADLIAIVQSRARDELRLTAAMAYSRIAGQTSESLDQLIVWVDDPCVSIRWWAIQLIGGRGASGARAGPAIARQLSDETLVTVALSDHMGMQFPVCQYSCEALGKIGPPAQEALPKLTEMMTRGENPSIRVAAALAVSRIDPDQDAGIQVLVSELQRSRQDRCDIEGAIEALACLGPRATPAWERIVKHSQDPIWESSRYTAFRALKEIDADRSIEHLIAALKNDPNWIVRQTAAECLGELGEKATPAISQLIRALDLEDSEWFSYYLRGAAAKALGQIGPAARDALDELQKLQKSDDASDFEKEAAAEAIRRINPNKGNVQ